MKTGRLLKFHRPGGDVHAYLYREGDQVHASIFVLSAADAGRRPMAVLSGTSEDEVERELRAWVERQFPKAPGG